jgi:cell division protein FtsN
MARDYKHRIPTAKKRSPKRTISRWQGLLIAALVFGFVAFLIYLKVTAPKEQDAVVVAGVAATPEKTAAKNDKTDPAKPKAPHFEFYTILPKQEIVVPDYEIKTREREERLGKAKAASYIMQVGSFNTFKEADQLKAKLALMGIASKVDKTKLNDIAALYRVKLGPFTQMTSVNTIRIRLKTLGANVIVTELDDHKP